ncbi:MAG TPA: DNA polymerase I [Bacteroidota bacterium]|nr:DNA polymerase I [Bacteroidota bacterium]
MKQKPTLYLIDGMALAYRSYYAFIRNPLFNSKGENTSSIFGFVNYMNKILEERKPDYLAVVFDTIEPTFRHKEYAEYKATRQKMPEDMSTMMGKLKEVVRAFNVPVLELPGFEADDIMGTLARRAESEKVETYLVTSDKDFMQLVSPSVKIYRPGKGGDDDEVIEESGVIEKFGVPPDQVIEVLGLTGDQSDNVPGVPGVGPKTAAPLVQKYGSIENILAHVDEIPQKGLREKLGTNRELALLSKRLVTIDTNAPLKMDFHRLKAAPKNTAALLSLYNELEFRNLARRLSEEGTPVLEKDEVVSPQPETVDIKTSSHEYVIVDSDEKYLRLMSDLRRSKAFVFDTETTSTDALQSILVGISFCFEPHKAYYLPVMPEKEARPAGEALFPESLETSGSARWSGYPLEKVVRDLKPTFENERVKKYGQNAKYDMLALSRKGIWVRGIEFDTMIASYALRSEGQHNLDVLAKEYLSYKMVSFEELTGTGKEKRDIREIPLLDVGNYSAEDADVTFQLVDLLHDKIAAQGMAELCDKVEFPLVPVLARMEFNGITIDTDLLAGMSKEMERQLDGLVAGIYDDAGERFNINSTQQLSTILFERLKLNPVRKTKTGFSTDVGVLETLRGEHPIVERLLEYRQLTKLKSTYVDALPKLIHPTTSKVHTSFNQAVAATGRLSSSDPNLQNIPIRTEMGREIRRAFIPSDKSMVMMSADYSQIELRIMAHISSDEGLLQAFSAGEDIHATTAAKVFGASPEDVTRDMRRKAKEVNFGIMYGIGPFGLASRLEITQTEAKEIIAKYFERFPKVNQYIADTIASVRREGYVETLLGRRRYLPEVQSKNANLRSNAERQAINMPIQGTAADMIKLAMIRIDHALEKENLQSLMLLQVHDELVFEVKKKELDVVRKLVAQEMRTAMPLKVPIEVEIGTGSNWLEAH